MQGLTYDEPLSQMSNKEIYPDSLLGILRYIPTKEKHVKEREELQAKFKFKHINEPNLLRACIDFQTEGAICECCKFISGT